MADRPVQKRKDSISIHTKARATTESLKKGKYDAVVYANGAIDFSKPPIPGWGDIPSVIASDVMIDPKQMPDIRGKKVVVIGGGQVGCECAWWLSSERGCEDVTLIEMQQFFMDGACTANRGWLIHYLEDRGVKLMSMTKALKIFEGRLCRGKRLQNKPDALCTWNPIIPKNIPNPWQGPSATSASSKTSTATLSSWPWADAPTRLSSSRAEGARRTGGLQYR